MKRRFNLAISAFAAVAALCACETKLEVAPEISASPESVTFIADGETKNVAVTTNIDDWTYSGQPEWVSVKVAGNSISLTAEPNPELEDRSGALVLTAGSASFTVELKQEKGSKYPGYTELPVCEAIYNGTTYQMFMPDCEGGNAIVNLKSEDQRITLCLEFFTEAFVSAGDVKFPEGTYTKGDMYEDYQAMKLKGTPMTYMTGGEHVISDEDGDEEFSGGSMIIYTVGDVSNEVFIKEGTFTVSRNDDGTLLLKTDMVTEDGDELKYYYEGKVEFDASYAVYPGTDGNDPTKVISVSCTYNGTNDAGATSLTLTLQAEGLTKTNICFNVPETAFADLAIEGIYSAPAGDNTGAAGTLDKGTLITMEGFSFPTGTYVMLAFNDYFIADGASMLMITKDESGKYTVMANIQEASDPEGGYLIMVENVQIEFYDASEFEDWD